jgi:hypothetical protein
LGRTVPCEKFSTKKISFSEKDFPTLKKVISALDNGTLKKNSSNFFKNSQRPTVCFSSKMGVDF